MAKYKVISVLVTKTEKYLIREVEANNKKEVRKIFDCFEPVHEEDYNEESKEKILNIDEI